MIIAKWAIFQLDHGWTKLFVLDQHP
jgi:hypothetical protein